MPHDSTSATQTGSLERSVPTPVPLVVDVDGTLLPTDLLWEGLLRILFERPWRLPHVFLPLAHGNKAAFKRRVASTARLDLSRMPLKPEVQRKVREARGAGRPVVLASAAHTSQVNELADRLGVKSVIATEGTRNVRGRTKLQALQDQYDAFDYVGDSRADLPVIAASRNAYLVDPGPVTRLRAETLNGNVTIVAQRPVVDIRAWLRQLRPHHWSKNALLLLPILAGHLEWTWSLLADVFLGLTAFSLLASAVYVVNDLADLPHDRGHPTKSDRPLASGAISIPAGVGALLFLLAATAVLASTLPAAFAATLGVYLALNLGYSWGLKGIIVLDVVLLTALYTIRVIAGAALTGITLTGWFLAFSIFFFLSLALLKRVVELQTHAGEMSSNGRVYRPGDLPMLRAAGPAAGFMSALVYCLYITGPVRDFYSEPEWLWVGLPLFLYWILRAWILASRGEVHEDPVVFVLRDRPSWAVLACFLLVVYVAS